MVNTEIFHHIRYFLHIFYLYLNILNCWIFPECPTCPPAWVSTPRMMWSTVWGTASLASWSSSSGRAASPPWRDSLSSNWWGTVQGPRLEVSHLSHLTECWCLHHRQLPPPGRWEPGREVGRDGWPGQSGPAGGEREGETSLRHCRGGGRGVALTPSHSPGSIQRSVSGLAGLDLIILPCRWTASGRRVSRLRQDFGVCTEVWRVLWLHYKFYQTTDPAESCRR